MEEDASVVTQLQLLQMPGGAGRAGDCLESRTSPWPPWLHVALQSQGRGTSVWGAAYAVTSYKGNASRGTTCGLQTQLALALLDVCCCFEIADNQVTLP